METLSDEALSQNVDKNANGLPLGRNGEEDLCETNESGGSSGKYAEESFHLKSKSEQIDHYNDGVYSADELSFNVSMTDLELLNNSSDFKKPKPAISIVSTCNSDDDLEEDDDDDEVKSLTNSLTSLENMETKERLFGHVSKLHCQLCGELFKDPKLLNCLHTYCASCIDKGKVKGSRLFFRCPVCTFRTDIRENVSSLETNLVLVKLVEAKSNANTLQSCVVCKMRGEETAVTHVCNDCFDRLCKDCAEKHTFTRLTAKHNVVEVENADRTEMSASVRNEFGFCENHSCEVLQYICHDCNVAACSECLIVSHMNHRFEAQLEAIEVMRKKFEENIETLNSRIEEDIQDTYREDISYLRERESAQEERLNKIAGDMIEIINKKVASCLGELRKQYILKKNLCTTRKSFIEALREGLGTAVECVNFLLKEGTAYEILPLQEKIDRRFKMLKTSIDRTYPRITNLQLPEVKAVHQNVDLLKHLSFFEVTSKKPLSSKMGKKESNKQGTQNNGIQHQDKETKIEMKCNNTSNKPLSSKGGEKESSKQGAQNNIQYQDEETKIEIKGNKNSNTPVRKNHTVMQSIGRGQLLSKGSLLGDYPGHQPQNYQLCSPVYNSASPRGLNREMHGLSCRVPTHKGLTEQKINGSANPFTNLCCNANLEFQCAINTQHRMDRVAGRITGLTFVDNGRFVACDWTNNRLTMFNTGGITLDTVQDVSPMSVTSCNGTLIWNADFNKIKMFNGQTNSVDVVKQFKWSKMVHPVSRFRQDKYLVVDRESNTIEAYNLSNQAVHQIRPKDQKGRPIKDIGNIAAREKDQVVMIIQELNKLYITDFDGNWIGEYVEKKWTPGCAAIDVHNNIFVTDIMNDRLILLDPRGRFMCQWQLQMKNPYCVACNGQGSILVSGNGNFVYHFIYKY